MVKHVVVIWGSVREGNYTSKAVALVEDELKKLDVSYEMIDPRSLTLGLPGVAVEGSSHEELQEKVKGATGIIFATPEYHGGMSSVSKLIIDNLGFPSVLAGKPVALLGVAAGSIGAIKALEGLRSILSHVGAIVLPGPVSVANCRTVFREDGKCLDADVEKYIRRVPKNLVDYIDQNICPRIALEEMVRK